MQPTKKKQVSVKDKLDDNTLDLSLMELTEVPVKEMAPLTRATIVDLSNNKLTSLPPNFATSLTFIVKLDLSKNQLHELPENFGQLRNLRHLDLFSNQLQRVPVSFCQLTQLKWLDLKNNPLVPSLAAAAGDCLDTRGCQAAARNVVKLMEMAKIELDKQQEKKLQQEKAREVAKKAKEAKEQEQLRQQKKLEKERRKAELRALHSQHGNGNTEHEEQQKYESVERPEEASPAQLREGKTRGCCGTMLRWTFYLVLLALLAGGTFVALHLEGQLSVDSVRAAASRALTSCDKYRAVLEEKLEPFMKHYRGVLNVVVDNTRETVKTVAERGTHYGKLGWEQSKHLFNHYWAIVKEEGPFYYKLLIDKVSYLINAVLGDNNAQKKQ